MFGENCVNGQWKRRTNKELHELCQVWLNNLNDISCGWPVKEYPDRCCYITKRGRWKSEVEDRIGKKALDRKKWKKIINSHRPARLTGLTNHSRSRPYLTFSKNFDKFRISLEFLYFFSATNNTNVTKECNADPVYIQEVSATKTKIYILPLIDKLLFWNHMLLFIKFEAYNDEVVVIAVLNNGL